MKKFVLLLMLACFTQLTLQAQENDSKENLLYFKLGESNDLTRVPISLHLENPSVGVTAMEMYLMLPDGATLSSGALSETRCDSSYELIEGTTAKGHFVSIVSTELNSISGSDGEICLWLCDFSRLSDGKYTLKASGMFAVGVTEDEVTTDDSDAQEEQCVKYGDFLGVEEIVIEEGKLEIYNLQGIRLSTPQKGEINIINGKKVKL